jgi:PAS domain S-box-containing protein
MDIPEEPIETPAGTRILHTRKVAIRGEQGEARYLLGISEDITERKQAEEEINSFKATLDKTLDCVFLFDPDSLRFFYVNQGAQDQVGYGRDELMEMTPVDIKPEFDEPKFRKLLESLISGEQNAITFETVHQHKDGHHLPVEVFLQYIAPNNEAARFVAIVRDITERKLAEEASRCHQRELAHVARLGTMGEMATGIAHELNQPLTALVSYCGTAASLVNSLPSPPQQLSEILELTIEQAHRAGDIVRNLREFVSKKSKDKETFEIDRVIYDIVTFLKSEVQKSGVKIDLHLGSRARKVKANRVQIEQVLVNLVRNSLEALEHTISVDGRVDIQTRLLPNDMVEVIVTDNGPGIDAAMAGKIFEQFQTSKEAGMGIGLSLSRSIIDAHGGSLWVDESYKNGALFGFELPVSK